MVSRILEGKQEVAVFLLCMEIFLPSMMKKKRSSITINLQPFFLSFLQLFQTIQISPIKMMRTTFFTVTMKILITMTFIINIINNNYYNLGYLNNLQKEGGILFIGEIDSNLVYQKTLLS